ncbi:polysaccharide pyruvyl transferase family protein [Jeongeupia sp. USM3]|uniref:polysaccharide pyruvyl transferase family protein n=1 Tax=Jeongeupia sp. USM3 TaxID=1906741 RepID=UPI00089DDE5A|nr:polysaccharide pyruvyl transferase family protein [Jeongeupia sp. USM3]AOY01892.1 hypothetical protein BJP62_16430 [Jeongeupia sp. USM3]
MNHVELISDLQSKVSAELDLYIQPGMRVALVDFPFGSNAGDSYIWLGQIEYLRRRGAEIVYSCWYGAYDPVRIRQVLGKDGVVLFHGGGNFGDLWPGPHALRLRVLQDLQGIRVIQFPQTVKFETAESIAATQAAIAAHGDVVLFLRDRASFDFAKQHFACPTVLTPDMAFFIGACQAVAPSHDGMVLARGDIESSGENSVANLNLASLHGRWTRGDWLESDRFEALLMRALCLLNGVCNGSAPGRTAMVALSNLLARQRLNRGIRQLSSGKQVVTDRLHAHILCLLLGKQHVVLDNNYGKISTFHQAWTQRAGEVRFASSIDDIPHSLTKFAEGA